MFAERQTTGYEFGPFRIDLSNRQLLRDGTQVALTPKVFDTLLVLVQNQGRVLEKSELMQTLWPDSFVDENNLAQNISALRKALGEAGAGHRWIVTVPGRGYRFEKAALHVPVGAHRHPAGYRVIAGVVVTVAVVAAAVAIGSRLGRHTSPPLVTTRLTSSGNVTEAAISADGGLVAIVTGDSGAQALAIRRGVNGRDIQLAPPRPVTYMGLTFSPAGTDLYAVVRENAALASALYRVPLAGDAWSKVTENVDSPVTFSPDGREYAFVREMTREKYSAVVIRDGTGRERIVAVRHAPEFIDYPAWSPDGQSIICTLVDRKNSLTRLISIPARGGDPTYVGRHFWRNAMHLTWSGSRGLVMAAREPAGESFSIWSVAYPTGDASRVTTDLEHYSSVGSTAHGQMIVATQRTLLTSIWSLQPGHDGAGKEVAGGGHKYSGLMSTADGRILFARGAGNVASVWKMNRDGSDQVELTHSQNAHIPKPCGPDGRIAYVSENGAVFETWLMDADGSRPHRVFQHRGVTNHYCSPDGKWIVHTATDGGWQKLWRTASDGSSNQKLADGWAEKPAVSPDGKHIACFYAERPSSTQEAPNTIAILRFEGGSPEHVFPIDDSVNRTAELRWTLDGTGISFIRTEKGVSNVWIQAVSGGSARKVTDFTGERIFYFCWSPDGAIFVVRGILTSDLVSLSSGEWRP